MARRSTKHPKILTTHEALPENNSKIKTVYLLWDVTILRHVATRTFYLHEKEKKRVPRSKDGEELPRVKAHRVLVYRDTNLTHLPDVLLRNDKTTELPE